MFSVILPQFALSLNCVQLHHHPMYYMIFGSVKLNRNKGRNSIVGNLKQSCTHNFCRENLCSHEECCFVFSHMNWRTFGTMSRINNDGSEFQYLRDREMNSSSVEFLSHHEAIFSEIQVYPWNKMSYSKCIGVRLLVLSFSEVPKWSRESSALAYLR